MKSDHVARIIDQVQKKPECLVIFAIGLLMGIGIKFPSRWSLSDSTLTLFGSFAGAMAAVGAAIWGANAKQRQEDLRSEERREHTARMIAVAIYPEFKFAKRKFETLSENLIQLANESSSHGPKAPKLLTLTLRACRPEMKMCMKFMEKFDCFGPSSSVVMDATRAMSEVLLNVGHLEDNLRDLEWILAKDFVIHFANQISGYSADLALAMKAIAPYGRNPEQIVNSSGP